MIKGDGEGGWYKVQMNRKAKGKKWKLEKIENTRNCAWKWCHLDVKEGRSKNTIKRRKKERKGNQSCASTPQGFEWRFHSSLRLLSDGFWLKDKFGQDIFCNWIKSMKKNQQNW